MPRVFKKSFVLLAGVCKLKILGAILILITTSWMGSMGGKKLSSRVRELQKLRNDFTYLEIEVSYNATPLPQIFEKLAVLDFKPVNLLWQELLIHFNNGEGLLAEEAWQKALDIFSLHTNLNKGDLNILRDFGPGFGLTGRQEQLKKFQLIHELLRVQQYEAEANRQKNERMWRSMGLLGGLALIILLY